VPLPAEPLAKLGFLTIGLFDGADPGPGHETTLRIIEIGERLGFDSAWVRHRHPQYGSLSVGPPMHYDQVSHALYPNTADVEDFSYARLARLMSLIRGEPVTGFSGVEGMEVFSDRVQPHSTGLAGRMWYGGASLRSAQWAGENGMNFLTSSVVKAEDAEDFEQIQLSHIRTFRAHHPDGERARVSQGLVVIPTDSASAGQRAKYQAYAQNGFPAPPVRRVRRGCCSPPTSSARLQRSPTGSMPTRHSVRSTRWRSRCRSASSTTTTCRS